MRRIVLNDPCPEPGPSLDGDAGRVLQAGMLRLLGAHTGPEGTVDYARLAASAAFGAVVQSARLLQRVDLDRLPDRAGRLAFWINVYNALVVHGIVHLAVRRTTWEVWNFFGRVSYRIGGVVVSLDEIEHGLLRDNARRVFPPLRPFRRRDPRRALAVSPPDSRIHFAITCGAQSCPPVGVYRSADIDRQLDLATRNFVNQEVRLDGRGRIECSKLFRWYRDDFARPDGIRAFLLRYLDDGPVRTALARDVPPCGAVRPYRWRLQHPPADPYWSRAGGHRAGGP